jgi:hypothetical protein
MINRISLTMEQIISDKLDQGWNKAIFNGIKPPVKECLRKQLHHLVTNQQNQANTTNTAPLLIGFYFEEGGKH